MTSTAGTRDGRAEHGSFVATATRPTGKPNPEEDTLAPDQGGYALVGPGEPDAAEGAAPDLEEVARLPARGRHGSIPSGADTLDEWIWPLRVGRPTNRWRPQHARLRSRPQHARRYWQPLVFDLAILATALISGSILRFLDLGRIGLNSDEAVYAGQAASLAGNPHFTGLFPVIRAHPLVFQVLISVFYQSGRPDVPGRYVSALFGVGTILLVYLLGHILYGRRVGAIAALLLAVMPYQVVVSREILLDGPMTFFATAALLCMAVFVRSGRHRWLVVAGACVGLAALTKETAIILVGSGFVFLALISRLWRPVRYAIAAGVAAVGLALTYPLVTAVSGGSHSGQSYVTWQLTRRPNHSFTFYLTQIPPTIGLLVLGAALLAVIFRRRHQSWREALLVAWVGVPFVFFEVWPVKGFPYLLVTTPAIVVLAASILTRLLPRGPLDWRKRGVGVGVVAVCVLSVLIPAIRDVANPTSSGLAGAGGTPGGRQAGEWVAAHVPRGAQLMTIGPSMANLIEYYSGHRSDGLSVSPNPAHRNPAYYAISNPSNALRSGTYQYVVWDAYSAQRSPTFAATALTLVHRFDGRVVHMELASFRGKSAQPVIVIYQGNSVKTPLFRLGAAIAAAMAGAGIYPAAASAAPTKAPTTPIQHLVVMTQDQHSFDNYFGTRPGVDGLPAGVCTPATKGSPAPCVKPFPVEGSGLHLSLVSSDTAQHAAIDRGRMDGFVYAQSAHTNAGKMAMGYYRPQDIPILSQMAGQSVLFDHWFSSVAAGSVANRLFAASGQSLPADGSVPEGGWGNMPFIFDRLQAAGVSWRIYVQNYEPALTITTAGLTARRGGQVARAPVLASVRFAANPELAGHVVDLRQYYADLASGKLPAVSYIVSTSATERPPANPTAGQVLARNVVNSLSESSAWSTSAFLLYYDSSGGWYDHVPPPAAHGTQLGPRVPALLISPYASPGTVDHSVLDSAAILKFIEANWSVAPLTSRDRNSANLASAFTFGQPARAPALLGGGDGRRPLVRPNTRTIYITYSVALIAVALAVGWAIRSELGRRVAATRPR